MAQLKAGLQLLKILTGTSYRGPRWTEWEFECIRQTYPIFPVEEISKLTGRTECAIKAKARILRVFKSRSTAYYPDELKALISTLLTLKKLSAVMKNKLTDFRNLLFGVIESLQDMPEEYDAQRIKLEIEKLK